jgi:hypothetical protein
VRALLADDIPETLIDQWSQTALPALGFYPKILGFFEAVGIFLGFYFEK